MPSGRSFYQRRPEGRAKEKKEFQRFIEKLKRLALERGYTKNQIATELGVSNTCIYQWWAGYSLSAPFTGVTLAANCHRFLLASPVTITLEDALKVAQETPRPFLSRPIRKSKTTTPLGRLYCHR
jgi:transposase-like protein